MQRVALHDGLFLLIKRLFSPYFPSNSGSTSATSNREL